MLGLMEQTTWSVDLQAFNALERLLALIDQTTRGATAVLQMAVDVGIAASPSDAEALATHLMADSLVTKLSAASTGSSASYRTTDRGSNAAREDWLTPAERAYSLAVLETQEWPLGPISKVAESTGLPYIVALTAAHRLGAVKSGNGAATRWHRDSESRDAFVAEAELRAEEAGAELRRKRREAAKLMRTNRLGGLRDLILTVLSTQQSRSTNRVYAEVRKTERIAKIEVIRGLERLLEEGRVRCEAGPNRSANWTLVHEIERVIEDDSEEVVMS